MPNGDRWYAEMYASQKVIEEKVTAMHDRFTSLPCSKDNYDIPDRIAKLENDTKWYKKIIGVVTGAIGALIVLIVEWIRG